MIQVMASMRHAFLAPKGYVWCSADFSGQELRIVGALSKDEAMLSTFKLGRDNPYTMDENNNRIKSPYIDLHYVAAEAIMPELQSLPISNRLKVAKTDNERFLGKSPRAVGKVTNFGLIYGLTASSLANDFNWPIEQAESTLSAYFTKFSGLKVWLDSTAAMAKAQKWVRLPTGRVCFVAESNAKGLSDLNTVGRKGCNAMVQGVGADMIKLALKYMESILHKTGTILVAVVHDECNFLIPGEWNIVDESIDDNGCSVFKFEFSQEVYDISNELLGAMIRAESDILSPLINEDFPCAADINLSPYWQH